MQDELAKCSELTTQGLQWILQHLMDYKQRIKRLEESEKRSERNLQDVSKQLEEATVQNERLKQRLAGRNPEKEMLLSVSHCSCHGYHLVECMPEAWWTD